MLEEEFRVDNQNDSRENSESEIQVDNFSKTTKLLDKKLKDKKDNILKVLEKWNLKDLFERLLLSDTEDKRKCIEELLTCENDEIKIKEVILANLPDWYAYNVSTNEVVKTEEKKDNDYIWATIMDQKTEQAKTDTEQAKTDTEQAKTDTEQAKTDTEQAVETKRLGESILVMRQAIEERDKLVAKYQSLEEKTNQNSEKFQTVRQQLENNWTLNQLRQNHDEQFINDYILVQTTLQELKSNPTNYEESDISYFDKIVKNLNNACNIPDTNLSSFSSENIAQTRTELFDKDIWNESLIQARNNNVESHAEAYAEIFPEMWTDEVIAKYGKFLQWDLKTFWQQYETNRDVIKNKIAEIGIMIKNQQIFSENWKNYISDEEKLLFDNYKKMLSVTSEIKKDIENRTKNMMEEMCLISQIKWMSMCIWQEEWKDFNLNKANEIINDNWVLTLKWHIDWVDFSVSHDTKNPDQHLKIKSKLWVNAGDKNTFEIWKDESYVDSPFILPGQDEIFKVISEVVKSNDILKSDDLSKYLEGLQNNIVWTMDEVYKDAELAHHYITNKVKWEKIVDNSLALIQWIKPNMQDLTKPINQGSNEKLFSFLKMIKFNVENSDTEEKNKLNQILIKIPEIKNTYRNNNWNEWELSVAYPPIIEHYLKNEEWLKDWNEDSKLWLVFDMFAYYNQNSNDTRTNKEWNDWVSSKIVINDLYRDLFEFSNNGQSEVWTKRKNENQEKQDKQEAEDVLALNDESIWPPVEYW